MMSDHELDIFKLDVKKINWFSYNYIYAWGLAKYILKENIT